MIKKMIFAVVVMAFSLNAHSGELVKKKDSFAAAAPPNFAMAHAVEGQTCHRSGDIGMSLDGLILSCQSGRWNKSVADLLPGALCGFGTSAWAGSTGSARCNGHNPATSCPSGYYQASWQEGNAGGLQSIYHCIKI